MSLDHLKRSLHGLAQQFGGTADAVAQAPAAVRGGSAASMASTIAGTAAAAAVQRIDAVLAAASRVPGATGPDVCAAIEALQDDLTVRLPDEVAATFLADDPHSMPLLFALLAEDADIAAVKEEAPEGIASLTGVARLFGTALGEAVAQTPEQVTTLLRQVVSGEGPLDIAPGARRVLGGSVRRVQASARHGAQAVFDQVLSMAREIQVGHGARVFPGRRDGTISLDRDYAGVVAGSYALLDRQDYRELYRVTRVGQGSRAEFALQGKSTSLGLAGANLGTYADKVRETTAYLRSERLERVRVPIVAPVAGNRLQVAADLRGMEAGRRVLVRGQRVDNGQVLVHAATVVSAAMATRILAASAVAGADGGMLVIDPPLPAALVRGSVVVFGNVAPASHGETVAQVLGSGDAAAPHQRFELKHAPLTCRAASTQSGVMSELAVRVGDVQWQQRASLHGAASDAHAYTLVTDEQGGTWVQFGDGVNGARLPTASNNLRTRYRKGLGAEGNVRADALSQAMSRPLGFKGVSNPSAASGGIDAEDAGRARRSIPLGARTLGRAVSVLDYEDFACAFAGVAKAQARALRLREGKLIALTIAGKDDVPLQADNPVRGHLLDALRAGGDPQVQVRLLAHRSRTFKVGLKVRCADDRDPPTVLAAVESTLRAQYAFEVRALARPVHASEVISVVHRVPGVIAVDLDFLYFAGAPVALAAVLAAEATRAASGAPAPADVLTLDSGPFVRLEAMR